MKLQQLRYIWEVAHHALNVSATAQSLYTSQPGISKQIRLLEDELGVEVFSRSGKHLTRVTPAGQRIIETAGSILRQVDSIKRVAQEFRNESKGSLSIATNVTQARFVLPNVIEPFVKNYPEVSLKLHQGSHARVCEMVANGTADFVIESDPLDVIADLVMMPCYTFRRRLLVPRDHPLTSLAQLSLKEIAQYPILVQLAGSNDQPGVEEAFLREGIVPETVLSAYDADVIKTYVRMNLGIGIVVQMACQEEEDNGLVALETSDLFSGGITRVGFRRGTFLRAFMYDFIERLAPHLDREMIDRVSQCHSHAEVELLFETIELPGYPG